MPKINIIPILKVEIVCVFFLMRSGKILLKKWTLRVKSNVGWVLNCYKTFEKIFIQIEACR